MSNHGAIVVLDPVCHGWSIRTRTGYGPWFYGRRVPLAVAFVTLSRRLGHAPAIMLRAGGLAEFGIASPEPPGAKPNGKGR